MKKTIISSVFILFLFFSVNAQKIGHVNIFSIFESLPEKKRAMEILHKETEEKKAVIKNLENKLQAKASAFRIKTEKFTESDFKNKIKMKATQKEQIALQEELKKIEELKAEALQSLQKKEANLTKPIEEKVITSINKIAKEKGLVYVFDSSQESVLLYIDTSVADDLTIAVKTDLGIK